MIDVRRRAVLLVGGVIAALTLAACGSGGGGDSSKMTVLMDWFPNPDHISLYTAQQMGAFKDEGLDVKLQPPSNNTDSLKLVSLGQMPVAISYATAVVNAEAQGLDVVSVAALIPTTLNSLILDKNSKVQSITDLKGKNIGSSGDPVAEAMWRYVLKQKGFSDSDIKFVSLNQGFIPAMVSGKVAAVIGAYQNIESVELRDHGLDPVAYPIGEVGIPNYDELVIIANRTKLDKDKAYRANVTKFLAGLAKGDAKAQADPAAALAAMKPVAKGYSADALEKMVNLTAPLLANPKGFGYQDISSWDALAKWMYDNKTIDKQVDVSKIVDNDLLPKK